MAQASPCVAKERGISIKDLNGFMKKIIKVVTLCSGYDAQCLALERLKKTYTDFDYELVSWAEVDRYAIQAHNALFPQWKDRNMGDITSCDWHKINQPIDLLTYSTPCQSISCAGKQEGLKQGSGTTSSIIWNVLDAIDAIRPKYLLMENVKALVSKKFIGDFHEWQDNLTRRGYINFTKVLNSKSYGIPQNRERVFMVSILDDKASFHFPEPFPLERRLKDILEEDVDERYYLKEIRALHVAERRGIPETEGTAGPLYSVDRVNRLVRSGRIPADRHAFLYGYNCSCAILAGVMRNDVMFISEPRIAALRGRNPENTSDRSAGCSTEQRLEIGGKISNAITTVYKDNLAVVPVCLNPKVDGKQPSLQDRIYDCGGISTAVTTGFMPKIAEPAVLTPKRNDYGKAVRKRYEAGEIGESRHNMSDLVPREDGICNTITSVEKDNLLMEPFNADRDGTARTIKAQYHKNGMANFMRTDSMGATAVIQVANMLPDKGYRNPQRGRIYSAEGISPTINTMAGGGLEPKIIQRPRGKNDGGEHGICPAVSSSGFERNNVLSEGYRIRRLTPRETFRLMDMDDEYIDRIQAAGISRTQQYKMAGNSIVVSCLYHIFRKMFVDTGCEGAQRTLF